MDKRIIVTTSWDDGDRADLRLAEMLQSRGMSGTFYVPVQPYGGRPALTHSDLRDLVSEGFEIGAHTVNHKLLWDLPAKELAEEIDPCKPILEGILGSEVRMFCYPCGRYDANVIRAVKRAGYWGARTVRMLSTRLDFSPFEMPTTVQIMPHTKKVYIKNVLRARKVEGAQVFVNHMASLGDWLRLSKELFDSILENGGMWHIYGHSHEIDKMGLWDELADILDYVAKRPAVAYIPNCELIRLQSAQKTRAASGLS